MPTHTRISVAYGIHVLISIIATYTYRTLLCGCRANVGEATYLDTVKNPVCPKMITVSAIMNTDKIGNFLFRNYQYPIGRSSRYPGSIKYSLWEGVRASSAAPGYYDDYKLGEHIHVVSAVKLVDSFFSRDTQ